jgi:hypothetical protein
MINISAQTYQRLLTEAGGQHKKIRPEALSTAGGQPDLPTHRTRELIAAGDAHDTRARCVVTENRQGVILAVFTSPIRDERGGVVMEAASVHDGRTLSLSVWRPEDALALASQLTAAAQQCSIGGI